MDPNEVFFYWNPKLLGLGRQIRQIKFGVFGVFAAELSAPILIQWKHGQGTHCTKMGADSLAKNIPNAPKFICPICLPKPKSLGFQWEKASLGVCSPCKIPSRPIWGICASVNNLFWLFAPHSFRNSTCFPSPSSFSFNKDTNSVGARGTVQSVQSFHKSPVYRVCNLKEAKSQRAFSVFFFMKMNETILFANLNFLYKLKYWQTLFVTVFEDWTTLKQSALKIPSSI